MSYQDASAMSSELNSAANASGDIFVTTKGMQESLLAINKTLGTNVMLNKEDLATMTKFRTTAGLTNEELAGIYKLTLGTNKSLEDATGEVLAQAKISSTRLGVALNEKEVLKEIKDVSAATTLSLGKNPSLIAEAVAVAKSLGMEMSKIDAIAESLLNFQSSIESELEAELLTGRQLNLEQARYYALTNDVAGLAEEISKNLGSSAEFGKMNRLQQEAIAKSVGMNREELAKTLFIQDQLKDVSKEDVEKRKELLNNLTEQYGIEGAQKKLKEKSIEDLENQASIQDRMNASVEKLREIFVTVAEAIMPAFDLLSSIFSIVGLMLKPLGGLINWGKSFGDVMGVIVGLLTAAGIAALVLNSSLTFGVGAAIALAAAGAGMAYLEKNKNQANKAGDILSPAKGKTTVSTKEGGLFELSKGNIEASKIQIRDNIIKKS
jgi:DNA-binding phage protein